MLDDALPDFERQVQPVKSGIPSFEVIDNAQRVPVVFERAAESVHLPIEFALADMSKRWMPQIMGKCQRFRVFLVQLERGTHSSGDLGNLDRMGQPVTKVIAETGGEDLCLALQTAKRPRMDNAVAITLKIVPKRVRRLGELPAAKICRTQTKSGEHYLLFGLGSELFNGARDCRRLRGASQALKQLFRFGRI